MNKLLVVALVSLAASVSADEYIVFKAQSRYRGAGMRVKSVELDKRGRVLLTDSKGQLLLASGDDIDWELSKKYTERIQEEDRVAAAKAEAAEAERRAAAALLEADRPISLLEASRRFGVANPSMTITEAVDDGSVDGPADGAVEKPAGPPQSVEAAQTTGAGTTAVSPELQKRLDRLKASVAETSKEAEQVKAELAALQADNNPDPLSASIRQSRIERKTSQLAEIDARLRQQQQDLARAEQEATAR